MLRNHHPQRLCAASVQLTNLLRPQAAPEADELDLLDDTIVAPDIATQVRHMEVRLCTSLRSLSLSITFRLPADVISISLYHLFETSAPEQGDAHVYA